MRIILACERFGRVRDAFRARGHDAWSCDLQSDPSGSAFHLQGDVLGHLQEGWDMMIAFPPCTYLTSSGLHWNRRRPERAAKTEAALEFARALFDAPIKKKAIENPVGCISTRIRGFDQIIQPYMFGEDASKATCLWLEGLPLLRLTSYYPPRMVCSNCGGVTKYEANQLQDGCTFCLAEASLLKPRWGNQTDSGQNRLGPSADRAEKRALTYNGIALAMADQWG